MKTHEEPYENSDLLPEENAPAEASGSLNTTLGRVECVPAKTIVTKNKSTAWFGAEYNMNIYRGCCHGCIYCDSRSDCYHVEDFSRVRAKQNALAVIRDDLARRVKTGVVATGAMSDPYNPFEKELTLTRRALELVSAYDFGIAIATKSDLICRDIDILQEIKAVSPIICKITITTPHDALAAKTEPAAPSSGARFAALSRLAAAGLFAGVLLMPVLPFINDNVDDILLLVRRAAESGARFVHPAFGMTMRAGQREYYLNAVSRLFPVENGKPMDQRYRSRYGNSYHCASPAAHELWQAFAAECQKYGLLYEMRDIVAAYKQGYAPAQLSFL